MRLSIINAKMAGPRGRVLGKTIVGTFVCGT